MVITIDPKLEEYIREQAAMEGLTVDAFIERLVAANQSAEEEIENLVLEALESGEPVQATSAFWEERHSKLDESLSRSSGRWLAA